MKIENFSDLFFFFFFFSSHFFLSPFLVGFKVRSANTTMFEMKTTADSSAEGEYVEKQGQNENFFFSSFFFSFFFFFFFCVVFATNHHTHNSIIFHQHETYLFVCYVSLFIFFLFKKKNGKKLYLNS